LARYTFTILHLCTFTSSTSCTAPPVGSVGWLEVGGPPTGPLAVSYVRVGRGVLVGLSLVGLAELLKLFPAGLYL
jgi:hypothetical protein